LESDPLILFGRCALLDEKTQLNLPLETLAGKLGRAGIDLKREIVVYGAAGSPYPYFAEFTIDHFGAHTPRFPRRAPLPGLLAGVRESPGRPDGAVIQEMESDPFLGGIAIPNEND